MAFKKGDRVRNNLDQSMVGEVVEVIDEDQIRISVDRFPGETFEFHPDSFNPE